MGGRAKWHGGQSQMAGKALPICSFFHSYDNVGVFMTAYYMGYIRVTG